MSSNSKRPESPPLLLGPFRGVLRESGGREPTPEELAEKLGMPPERVPTEERRGDGQR
jgi:DNA-directed RNA polymerase sigma subunit (sigma70/sigma32)